LSDKSSDEPVGIKPLVKSAGVTDFNEQEDITECYLKVINPIEEMMNADNDL
jgi:hypothetical protein